MSSSGVIGNGDASLNEVINGGCAIGRHGKPQGWFVTGGLCVFPHHAIEKMSLAVTAFSHLFYLSLVGVAVIGFAFFEQLLRDFFMTRRTRIDKSPLHHDAAQAN